MATITVSGPVTKDDVAKVVTSKLGAGYPVRPSDDADSFLVGKGILHAQVKVETGDQSTKIQVIPFGLTLIRTINAAGVARKVKTALQQSELRPA